MLEFIKNNNELIIDLLTILIQIGALGGLIWQTRKTFEAERKASTKQFLNEAQLESAKEILKTVDKAYNLIIESGVMINREVNRLAQENKGKANTRKIFRDEKGNEIVPFYDKQLEHINRHNFFKLTHEAETLLKNIDIYIHFIPELKDQLEIIKTKINEYRYLSRSILDVDYPTETAHRNSIEKQVSLQDEISSLRDNLITFYSNILKELNEII